MDFGASMFFTDYSMRPGELGQALEARGFESVWAPEHSHIPALAAVAAGLGRRARQAVLRRDGPVRHPDRGGDGDQALKIATGVCLVIQRDTIQTAKLVASLDQVSGGRFLFGIGGGWNAEEMADHGTEFKTRFKKMREQIEAMRAIWTKSEPEYHGDIVDFPKMRTWPKPVQKPHPPVIVGGAFPHSARRAIRYGDGWVPNASRPGYADVTEFLPQFRADGGATPGATPRALPISIFGAPENLDRLKRYRDQGIARIVVTLPSAKARRDPAGARPLGPADQRDRALRPEPTQG